MTYTKEYEVNEHVRMFLERITKPDGSCKRVISSPLRYAGGKSKAVGILLRLLPVLREKKVVSPFFGGGSFELCLSQELDIPVVGYDIFGLLVNFWNVLVHEKEAFLDELKKFHITKEEFDYNRHVLLHYWEKIKPRELVYQTRKKIPLDPHHETMLDENTILQAVYYYYNMSLSYGPMFLGWPSSNEIHPAKFRRRLERLHQQSFQNLEVHCDEFEHALKRHSHDFLFLDPPYYLEGDSKMFKGMYPNCNFAIHHTHFPHETLRDLLKKHKGGFMMTYNNCGVIREWYKEYIQEFPEWQYTFGQGETRIGKHRTQQTHLKESHEIVIIQPPSE